MRLVKDQITEIDKIIKLALDEDRHFNDITTKSLNFGNLKLKAVIKAKEDGVCAGINIAGKVFKAVDKNIKFKAAIKDGNSFNKNGILAEIEGNAKTILSGERTALNFLSHLSGIAALTRQFVDKVRPYNVRILDTRKTTPGLRLLEKYAVRMGGGYNHRFDLAEAVLIKDNHIVALKIKNRNLDLGLLVSQTKKKAKNKEIEIEVTSVEEFKQVINHNPDIIMLDNMGIANIKACVLLRNKISPKTQLEISGDVNLDNIKTLSSLGAERISIGALTHSVKSLDMSLDIYGQVQT